jgi:hypothetical protein
VAPENDSSARKTAAQAQPAETMARHGVPKERARENSAELAEPERFGWLKTR